jgi:hypothetical protein
VRHLNIIPAETEKWQRDRWIVSYGMRFGRGKSWVEVGENMPKGIVGEISGR